jgi:hypothetical protein
MRVGFTGTQQGMTDAQKEQVLRILAEYHVDEFHHGDCIGADEEFHNIVAETFGNENIIIHPPSAQQKRAFCKGGKWRKPKAYLDRNFDIVDETDILIATPKEDHEVLRSGTWATIRYGRKDSGYHVYCIYPDGHFDD